MSKNIKIISDISLIDKNNWALYVQNNPNGNAFQTPQMYDVYEKTPNYTPRVFIAYDANGYIIGCLLAVIQQEYNNILGYFTSRSIITGGPIADKMLIVDELLQEYNKEIKSTAVYSQIRNEFDQLSYNDAFQNNGYRFESHLNFLISLDSEEAIWNRICKGRRKQIEKAQKNNLSVIYFSNEELTEELIIEGFDIIKNVYKRAKLPLADIELLLQARNNGLLNAFFVIKDDDKIGCRFTINYKDTIFGWYAGSYDNYYNLYPNDILIWETLKWGVKNNYKVFNYGGAGSPNKAYGVRTFKSQLGGRLVNHGRYEIIHKPFLMLVGKLAFKIYKILKNIKK